MKKIIHQNPVDSFGNTALQIAQMRLFFLITNYNMMVGAL